MLKEVVFLTEPVAVVAISEKSFLFLRPLVVGSDERKQCRPHTMLRLMILRDIQLQQN